MLKVRGGGDPCRGHEAGDHLPASQTESIKPEGAPSVVEIGRSRGVVFVSSRPRIFASSGRAAKLDGFKVEIDEAHERADIILAVRPTTWSERLKSVRHDLAGPVSLTCPEPRLPPPAFHRCSQPYRLLAWRRRLAQPSGQAKAGSLHASLKPRSD